jgi:hypothetical protein
MMVIWASELIGRRLLAREENSMTYPVWDIVRFIVGSWRGSGGRGSASKNNSASADTANPDS